MVKKLNEIELNLIEIFKKHSLEQIIIKDGLKLQKISKVLTETMLFIEKVNKELKYSGEDKKKILIKTIIDYLKNCAEEGIYDEENVEEIIKKIDEVDKLVCDYIDLIKETINTVNDTKNLFKQIYLGIMSFFNSIKSLCQHS